MPSKKRGSCVPFLCEKAAENYKYKIGLCG